MGRADPATRDSMGTEPVVSAERLASALDEAVAKLEAVRRAKSEPIAVIGVGCRFPGGADGPDAYWRLLRDGVDATGDVPAERWDVEAYFDPDPDAAGKMYVRRGGFLAAIGDFDARFFEISPREAASMDPQQRLLLEVAWEALEHAGLAPAEVAGSATGVFVGATTNDYGGLLLREGPAALDTYFSTGNALNATPGRLAHVLGVQGPALALDTACSSSLVAVHLACQSLRAGECDAALAGGVNLILAPEVTVAICRARMLAPDGRCKTFDAAADGYARGEGCGVVVLKRWSDAVAVGDRVLALIRGSAVNQDGATSGFTVPNGRAQEALIRKALGNARVEPSAIDYLETHGTGTALGDPIEVQAAASVLGRGREAERPLLLGSVKTNVGHTEAAAGIAGLIKVVLALCHGEIPPHLHFHAPNPHIPWARLPVAVAAEGQPWPVGDRPRLAGVSSFGASGTNAHVIVQEAPDDAPRSANVPERPRHILALSAKTETALRQLAGKYADYLNARPDSAWADVCFGANTGRSHFEVRAAVAAASSKVAEVRLRALASGGNIAVAAGRPPKPAFLFTGQGSQYVGMGRRLYETQPTFRSTLDRCGDILGKSLDRPLADVLYSSDNAWLDDTVYTQPALFALEYALAELWKSWGVRPAAVMGHSVGEYAAACVAGVFSLEEGLWLIARRAELMGWLPAGGAMAALTAGPEPVLAAIAPHADEVSVAAFNAPDQTVISGRREAVESVLCALAASGIAGSLLRVSHAFHSPWLEPMLAEFERAAGQVNYRTPDLLFVSNLSGEPAMAEVASAGYWVRHAREPVKFAAGIETLFRLDCNVFVEIGPARALLGLSRRSAPDNGQALWLPSLQREDGDWEPLLGSLGQLYARGFPVDWRGFDHDYRRVRPALPTYPWQRESHWRPAAAHPGRPAVSAEPESAAWRSFRHGDAASLLKQLAESGEFSAEELKLAPRLLEALAQPPRPERADLADAELLYEVAWRPQAAAVPPSAPDFWPAPGELAARMRPRLSELAPADADAAYRRVLARLEELCIDYVAEAWEQLGWTFRAGSRCRRAELAECLGVVERHRRFLERTAEMLAEAGLLRSDGDGWEAAAPFTSARPGERIGGLLAECPAAAAELILLDRCAGRLADVLRGRQDPLLLLFPEDDAISASSLYRDSPGARLMNRVLHEAAALAVKQLPVGRKLRVLEIGAGTGGTTAGLLDLLPAGQTDYLFTDISPRFTTAAREQFERYRFVRYRVLDIERDPATQDFAGEAPFDLIVAANVLHATRDLRQTLRHVRQLAAPGALLLLLEGTAPIRTIDLVFGLTEGWWRFAGDGVRARHPLISPAEWATVLNPCGFPEVEPLALADEPREVLAKQVVMVARAGDAAIPEPALTFRHWLILADRGGIGERLASRHGERGGASTLVYPGPAFERLGDDAFRIAPDQPEDFCRLLAALDPGRDHEVVHLWSLDEPAIDAAPDLSRIPESRLSCGSVVNLVRAVAEGASGLPVWKTWLVTRGAVGGGPFRGVAGLAQAGLWGLARVAAREHPELGTVRLDLDPEASAENCARLLWDELSAPPGEDEVAFRTGARYVSRLVRHVAAEAARPVEFRDDASYLITGGLGGLGLLTARWMARRGAKNLVLVGRRPADQRAEQACRELEAMGAQVLVSQADVAQYPEMQRVLAEAAASLPPLRGIIHGAGVLDDGMLRQLTFERLDRVMRPKVAGAWNLHCLTHGTELDFFVLYSSFTGVLGTPGQANHAAANAFLDALAWHRRGLGLPALSLDWGAWSEIGAAAERRVDERLEAKGGGALSPAQALRLLEAAWRAEAAQIAAVPIYWTQLDEPLARRPLFAELAPAPGVAANRPADFLERFRAASRPRRRALLAGHVLAETAKVLGLKGADAIEPSQGFFALGMDSLTSLELRNRLRTSLQCELPTTVAFDHPDPDALADFLLGRIDPPEGAPAPAVAAPPAEPAARDWEAADLDRLPVAELENLIDALAGPA